MRSFLRKYINNRGSALFMVLSTMTALMISCMAMYFSVISSRSTQYAIFFQQQSKQVAMSIGDTILAGFMDQDGVLADKFNELLLDMMQLPEGGKISTGSNGFSEFDESGSGKEADDDLGSYRIDITCISVNDDGSKMFDITVTTVLNGSNNVYHTVFELGLPSGGGGGTGAPTMTDVFAATGYVPNDVFLDGGRIITDLFFDNEMTIVNAYGQKNMQVWGDMATGGSLTVNKYLMPSNVRVSTFAVRGD